MNKELITYGNAKKYFVTPKKEGFISESIYELLSKYLKNDFDIKSIILSGGVWVDRKRVIDPNYLIKIPKTIIVYVSVTQGHRYVLNSEDVKLETKDFLIVYKEAQVTSVPDRSNLYMNLSEGVRAYLEKKGSNYLPTPITRLDFMVDGLVIFAKHKQAEKELFKLSMDRKIWKMYKADVLKKDGLKSCLRIKDKLIYKDKAYVSKDGKLAHSLFMKNSENVDSVTYKVIIFTGRRHQIRVHAAEYLSPIIGDSKYSSQKLKNEPMKLTAIAYNFNYKNKKVRIRL